MLGSVKAFGLIKLAIECSEFDDMSDEEMSRTESNGGISLPSPTPRAECMADGLPVELARFPRRIESELKALYTSDIVNGLEQLHRILTGGHTSSV